MTADLPPGERGSSSKTGQQKIEPLPTVKHDGGNNRIAEKESHHEEEGAVANTRQHCDAGVGQQLSRTGPSKKKRALSEGKCGK